MRARARVATQVAMREYRRNPPTLHQHNHSLFWDKEGVTSNIEHRSDRSINFRTLSIRAADKSNAKNCCVRLPSISRMRIISLIIFFRRAKRSGSRSETDCVFQTRVQEGTSVIFTNETIRVVQKAVMVICYVMIINVIQIRGKINRFNKCDVKILNNNFLYKIINFEQ